MGPFDGMIGKGLKPLTAQKQKIHAQTIKTAPTTVKQTKKPTQLTPSPSPSLSSAKSKSVNGDAPKPQGKVSRPRPRSQEPKARIKQEKASGLKRSSPAISTPRFDSDHSDEDVEVEAKKRRKVEAEVYVDTGRCIRDVLSFADDKQGVFSMVHAADIANLGTDEKPNPNYATFFTALTGDEDEAPIVELQYPSASQRERYQMVQGKANDDFKPLDEIIQVISTVAENYLQPSQAEKINDEASGILRHLKRARLRGYKGEAGAQSKYVAAVDKYNSLIDGLRHDGSIQQSLDQSHTLKLLLVETILQQIYARTVSPHIHTLRAYENGTDNVYGELLPRFCSTIFQQTQLNSSHVFVDLGSGVANVVLQAALQIGCESWGCEMMPNASDLAALQQREFTARCRLWGLRPGAVHLERGDFLQNETIGQALKRADVVLINNQAFTPSLNDKLIMHFLDLKEGCRIVSLKSFVPHGHKMQARNMGSPLNVLEVRELEYFSNSVSWTDAPGSWFIQVKDAGKVEAFQRGVMNGKRS
jgi:[histone H3]-lysine79 N-trimethyltransferase